MTDSYRAFLKNLIPSEWLSEDYWVTTAGARALLTFDTDLMNQAHAKILICTADLVTYQLT